MAFARPTLTELVNRIQLDFISRLSLTGAVLRRSIVFVLARVLAGAAHMLHGHLEYLGRQLFPDQSDDLYLTRQASLFGITKLAPTYATASLTVTGTGTIPLGTALIRADGAQYTTNGATTITGTGSVSVTASVAGAAGSLTVGAVLVFVSPISGITSTAVVASKVDGNDAETTEDLRVRLLEHLAEPAHGGTEADYIAWAKLVLGVTRVWVSPLELGPGTVVVRFVRDNDPTPIPDAGKVAAVQSKIDSLKPVHATVTAIAPIDAPIAMTLHISPDTPALRTAVTAELTNLLASTATPGSTTLLSAIRTAIGSTSGISDYTLTTPSADITHTTGQLASVGTITWF
jgi:uncharacterized phage protein gp47/JayE